MVFSAKLNDSYFGNAKGGGAVAPTPTPCAVEDGEMASAGEG